MALKLQPAPPQQALEGARREGGVPPRSPALPARGLSSQPLQVGGEEDQGPSLSLPVTKPRRTFNREETSTGSFAGEAQEDRGPELSGTPLRTSWSHCPHP